MVHCSDGWDRTTQIISLAQIMIDPHFRTIKGFQNLIDKDWIRFGHKFRLRNGIGFFIFIKFSKNKIRDKIIQKFKIIHMFILKAPIQMIKLRILLFFYSF